MPAVTPRVSLPERFEILTHVANGGMASVWSAEDRVLGRTVAVKLLAEQFVGDARAKVRFMREARAAAALSSHPHNGTAQITMKPSSGVTGTCP